MASGSQNMTTYRTSILQGAKRSTDAGVTTPAIIAGEVYYAYNVNNDIPGFNTSNNANGILTLNTHAGNYYHQLGFSSDGHVYHHSFSNAALATSGWVRLVKENGTSSTWAISISGNAATADKWKTTRTLTIGATGKNVDGSGNVSWSKNEILGASTNAYFLRGDKEWSNTLNGAFTANGTITANGGYLKSTANSNTVTIGSQNTSYTHIYNSANIPFIFNNTVESTNGDLGTTSYPWHNIYIGPSNGAGIYYKGTNNTYRMIRFIDNASDIYGNGISIGGGGLAVFGAGESADTILSNLDLAAAGDTETTYIGSDGSIEFYPSINSWDASARIWMTAGVLNIGVDGNTTRENSLNVYSGAGRIQLYSAASTTGNRGLWVPAHGSGSSKNIIVIDTNNNATFTGNVTGNCSGSSGSCTGNAATATRINGNLAKATSDVNRNIWVSSTASADGIPNYISGFNMNPSTNVFTVPAGTRISPSTGALYLGNSENQSWVYVQDMCSQDGQKWKIHQNGNAEFNGTVTAPTFSGNAATATKATQDGNGANIASTYLKMNTAGGIASGNGGGQYWIIRVCTIKITSTYINRPIVLEISGRGRPLSLVQIIFQSVNGTDPGLTSFVSNYGNWFYIKKTTTSTWEVYAHYSESWGSFCLHRITGMGADIGVTVNMDNYSTSNAMPSGATQVSYGGNVNYANSAGSSASCTGHASSDLALSGGVMTGQIEFNNKGSCRIFNGPNDAINGVGGALNNLVIGSWYGVSFTTDCTGQTYTQKTAVAINCRNGNVYAARFNGPLTGDVTGSCSGSAAKLGTANKGDANHPIYLSGGTPYQCNYPHSGAWYSSVPYIHSDGMMEIGRYIDFHGTNTTTADHTIRLTCAESSARIDCNGIFAATGWSDLAEYRRTIEHEPGRVVIPTDCGIAKRATKRLQPGARIVSDTYGFCLGECDDEQSPIALTGRVLAYPCRSISEYHAGDAVCSGPNGTVDLMTREEIQQYPDCIIGIVNEIPTYPVWNPKHTDDRQKVVFNENVEIRGRIWIDVK